VPISELTSVYPAIAGLNRSTGGEPRCLNDHPGLAEFAPLGILTAAATLSVVVGGLISANTSRATIVSKK
jgi:hypothetical protein